MKALDAASLKLGDIILTSSFSLVSKTIRAGIWSDISHALLYVQDHSVIDATRDGVHARNTQRLIMEDGCAVHVLRFDELTESQLQTVCEYARQQVGTQYSVKEAVQTGLGRAGQQSKKQFCSRLVAQAYFAAGIRLVPNADFCSPKELRDSPLLRNMGDLTVQVSQDYLRQSKSALDITKITADATNAVLKGARRINPSIQSLSDVSQHLITNPKDDDVIADLYEASGYLLIWQVECERSPWQYEVALMELAAREGLDVEGYCRSTLADEKFGGSRFIANRDILKNLYSRYRLRTFRSLLALYEKLVELQETRVLVARSWLQLSGFPINSA